MKTSFEKIICPYCGKEHEVSYIPTLAGDYDEFYIKCESCKETFITVVYIDKKEESPIGLKLFEYFKTNDVCIETYKNDDEDFEED